MKTILKGLYIGAAATIMLLVFGIISYLFTGLKVPFGKFFLEFLYFFSSTIAIGGCAFLVTAGLYAIAKEGYIKLFAKNEKNS